MVLFTSEMHLFTSVFVIMELMILTFQLFYFYSRPQDRKRLWFLILLVLLIFYNLSTGLLSAESFGLSVLTNMFAYGSGFLLAAYLPWYCYKVYGLSVLRFHVRYGVVLFLILPYLIFFAVVYPLTADLAFSLKWGRMVPFVYSLVLVWVLLSATWSKVVLKVMSYSRMEMCTVCLAVVPWIFMTVFSVFPLPQWAKALMANFGVVVVSVMYMVRSEMNKFYADLELLLNIKLTLLETFFFASMIHLVFVKIHPWNDGNGRTARLIEKWFLAQKLGIKAWFIQSEKYYFLNHETYYSNIIALGLEYLTLDYTKTLSFLLMLPKSVTEKE